MIKKILKLLIKLFKYLGIFVGIISIIIVISIIFFSDSDEVLATKSNHAQAVQFLNDQVMKCTLGSDSIILYSNKLDCSFLKPANISHVVKAFQNYFIESGGWNIKEEISCIDAKLHSLNLSALRSGILVISKYKNDNTSCLEELILIE